MLNLRTVFRILLHATLVIALITGCSAEARKSRHLSRAEKYFRAGDFEKAKLEYMNVIRIDPKATVAFQRTAAIWLEQGAPMRAGPFLARAREINPRDAESRLKLARLLVSLGGLAEGRKEAQAAVALEPGNAEAVRLLVEASRTPAELAAAAQALQNFPAKESAPFKLAVATMALKQGDIPNAEAALKTVLQLDPKNASAHTAMAAINLMRKDVPKAGEEFKAAAEASPLRSTERIQYAEFRAQTSGAKESIEALKAIIAQAPDYIPASRLLAQIALAQKRYDEAASDLENVFKYDADNVDSRMVQAQVLIAKGDGAKAVEVLERLEKIYPKVASIKIQLARANLLINKPSEATAALNDALAQEPQNVEAKVLMAETNMRRGDAQAVVNGLTEVLQQHPELGQAKLMLADSYRLLGRYEDAASIFRDQLKANPQNAPAYLGLGVIMREEKKDPDARAAFEKALELSPGNLIAINQLVELDLADKAYDAALQRTKTLLASTPNSGSAHLLEGKIYAAQAQWPEAEAALTKALELEPSLGPAYDLLISADLATNDLPKAAATLETLLTKNPQNPGGLMQLALVYEKMNEFAKAASTYEKLVAIKSDSPAALNNLAYLYAEKLNQLDKAADASRKARSLQPSDPAIADTFGWILYRQGDYQQALSLLQESAAKLGDNPEAQYHLGSAAYMMSQTEMARAAFQKATQASAAFPGKAEAQRRLALLGDGAAQAEMSNADLESLVKQQPNDLIALTRLGERYEKDGQPAKAAEAYERALKVNPKLVQVTVKLAQLYAGSLKEPVKALELAKKARELAPSDPNVSGVIGVLAYQTGNYPWAYSLLQEALRQKPNDPDILLNCARAAYLIGKSTDAQQLMERLLAAVPNSPLAGEAKTFLTMTALEQHSENLSSADSQVDAALKENSDYAPALMIKAEIQTAHGQTDKAKEIYNAVLRQFPDFALAQKNLARLYANDPAELSQAFDLATKARKVLPNDPELLKTLGEICYKRNDFMKAIQILKERDRAKTLDSPGLFYLGMSYAELKQKPAALETLRRALDAGLATTMSEQALKAIDDLKRTEATPSKGSSPGA
ncbi:MAG: tetratricopeptide repeat protein [Chthoniobacterales bacterium]